MINCFLNLVATAGEIGSVTEAHLYNSRFVSINILMDGKEQCTITFTKDADDKNEDS